MVTPIGNETGIRIIQVDFPTSLLDGTAVDSVIVTLDGLQIQNVTSMQQLLSPPTAGVPNYVILTTGADYEVLVSIPHFSQHSIQLTFPDVIVTSSVSSSASSSGSSPGTPSTTTSTASSGAFV